MSGVHDDLAILRREFGLNYPLQVDAKALAAMERIEAEVARLEQEREGYKLDFLAASERCGIAEKERDRLQLILADINPDGGSKGFLRSGLDERTGA